MDQIDWRYWAALAGTAIWVGMRDAEKEPVFRRLSKTAASGLLAAGGSRDVAPYLWGSEIAAAICIMAVGLFVLDMAVAIVTDRSLIKDIVRARLGAPKSDGGSDGGQP